VTPAARARPLRGVVEPPIRVALVGFGTAGRYFHAPFIAADPDLKLEAVVTGNAERARQVTDEYPGVRVVPTLTELVAVESDLDLLVVASPPAHHAEHARWAITRGVGVVLDKPMTLTAGEGAALAREARSAGVLLTVYQNRRWDDDFMALRRVVDTGAVGRVFRFESRFEWWKPLVAATWKGTSGVEQGGGLLYDLGPHLLDQAIRLFGPARLRYVGARRLRASSASEDDVHIVLAHDSGVESDLSMSALVGVPLARFRLLGTDGAWTSDGLDPQEAALKAGLRPGGPEFAPPGHRHGWLGRGDHRERLQLEPGGYGHFYRAVAESLTTGSPPPVDPTDALEVLGLIEEIHASITLRGQGE
jgi:predicted dehydrogenase